MARQSTRRVELCLRSARELLEHYHSGHDKVRLPVNIEHIAHWLGYQVIRLFTVQDEFSGLVSVRQKLIGINGRHHRHRQRFSVAHELAHILLKHPPESRCITSQISLFNGEADICAAELLMPSAQVLAHGGRSLDPAALAVVFDVSEVAALWKLKEMGLSRAGAKVVG